MSIGPELDRTLRPRRGLPVILQSEAAECGLVCLAMICHHYGLKYTLVDIRRQFSTSLKGMTLKAIIDASDCLGFSARPIRVELTELVHLKCPAILHWDMTHFVVLKRATPTKLWIHDPARGLRFMSMEMASRSFTGVALELTPIVEIRLPKPGPRLRFSDALGSTRGLSGSISQLIGLAALLQMCGLAAPLVNQLVIDDVLGRGDTDLLSVVTVVMGGIIVISTFLSLLRGLIGTYFSAQLSFQMQANMLRHVLRLPVSWFEKRHLGDILSRFGSLKPIQDVLTTVITSVVLDGVTVLLSLVMLLVYAPVLTGVQVCGMLIVLLSRAVTFSWMRDKMMEGMFLSARVQSTFMETIRGIRTFKTFGRERERFIHWQNEQILQVQNSLDLARLGIWGGAGASIVSGLQQVIIWFLGARMVLSGHFTIGMLVAFQGFSGQFSGSASRLVGQVFTIRALGIHLERLADVASAEPEPEIAALRQPRETLSGDIKVKDLSFRYAEHEPWVLRRINLDIRAGEWVCLVGPSGQGKSTLMKVILGYYEAQEGHIEIDGERIDRYGMKNFRDKVGVVMQDDTLFSGTIADNISLFDPDMTMKKVEGAAKMAQIHDEIVDLPMGYQSLVGDMGSVLSGGQKQRIFLARALYRDPRVLFLDEGTANLDPENERLIMGVLGNLNITRVFIAHREAAVAGADRVITVAGGGLLVHSGHDE